MQVNSLKLSNFRNLKGAEIYPDPNMNVICGPNAQGKTNIIEAIWLFTGAKSFRGAKDNELVNFDENSAKISLSFLGEGTEKQAVIDIEQSRVAYFNDKKLSSPAKLAGKFLSVVFSPTDLKLVKDSPSVRRKFLDLSIGKLNPVYIDLLLKYNRILTQRNSLLKDIRYNSSAFDMLASFDEQIIPIAEKIVQYRKDYVALLCKTAGEIYKGISGEKETLSVEYELSFDNDFKTALSEALHKDAIVGSTSVGPHRDDLIFKINNNNARQFSSQGQQRSIAIALKLAEAAVIREKTGENPVALLDDVFSELDPSRQDYILNHIKDWQVFVTCCDPANIKNLSGGKIFNVLNGEIK